MAELERARPLLTIVMPAFDEGDVLDAVIRELFEATDRLPGGEDSRVIVVDDGSTDDTREVLERLAAVESRLSYRRHSTNRGFGAAVRTAIEAASTPYVLMIPADGQWDPSELPAFYEAAVDDVTLAVGVRDGRSVYGWKRRLLSVVYSLLLRVMFHPKCPDLAWVHLYDLRVVDWRTPRSTSPFYPVEIALWNLATRIPASGFRQLPSGMRRRAKGRTKVANARVMWVMTRDLVSCSRRVRRERRARRTASRAVAEDRVDGEGAA